MKTASFARTLLCSALLVAATAASAADIVPINADGPGTGLNDATPAAPVGLNPGTTIGQQRQIVYQFAADLWGAVLESSQPVFVGASFPTNLACTATGAVLGSAGTTFVNSDFAPGIEPDTWYHAALADAISGTDLNPGFIDINSRFNANLGGTNPNGTPCLTGSGWYYGLDGNTPAGKINFLNVVLHEIGHGLGFSGFTGANGAYFAGRKDIYTVHAYDNVLNKTYPQLTQAQRATAIIAGGRTVWNGAEVTRQAALTLNQGRTDLRVTAPAAAAGSYDFTTAAFGAPATTANFSGTVVQALDAANPGGPLTTDACTTITNPVDIVGKLAIVDRGTCGFAVKAANVQAAGATGMIVANSATSAFGGMGGVDPAVTIPSVMVRFSTGTLLKANLPAQAGLVFSPDLLVGADDAGRARLYAPSPHEPGSSFSHYDTFLSPNALMEPAITSTLRGEMNIDLTPALFDDIGWTLNPGGARIGNCVTKVDAVEDGGIIVGANVAAWSGVCASISADKGAYQACMDVKKEEWLASGMLTGKQAGSVMSCAARILK